MEIDLDGVAWFEEILSINVRDHHLLLAIVHAIEAAIGVLFEHREVSEVVLVAIGIQSAEYSQPGFLVRKNKASKIAIKRLDSGAGRDEVVVAAEIGQFDFNESFLQANMGIQPCGSVTHVDVDDAVFLHGEVVDVHFGRDFDAPVHGLERCVAVKQVE